jgi:outer membrane receptor protein involved in Fe transport
VVSADRGWELAAFAQNVTDEFAVTSIVAAGNFPVASFNKPRTFGLELARRF